MYWKKFQKKSPRLVWARSKVVFPWPDLHVCCFSQKEMASSSLSVDADVVHLCACPWDLRTSGWDLLLWVCSLLKYLKSSRNFTLLRLIYLWRTPFFDLNEKFLFLLKNHSCIFFFYISQSFAFTCLESISPYPLGFISRTVLLNSAIPSCCWNQE